MATNWSLSFVQCLRQQETQLKSSIQFIDTHRALHIILVDSLGRTALFISNTNRSIKEAEARLIGLKTLHNVYSACTGMPVRVRMPKK